MRTSCEGKYITLMGVLVGLIFYEGKLCISELVTWEHCSYSVFFNPKIPNAQSTHNITGETPCP
jgi:hypothetical protein